MDKKKILFEHTLHSSAKELNKTESNIIQLATDQLEIAYAPYSQFLVGAALVCENGEIHVGCNQENASYPLCMCAERVALYSLGARRKNFKILAIAIIAKNLMKEHKGFCMPCGACRQVIQEYEQRQNAPITLLLAGEQGQIMRVVGVDNILPMSFSKQDLL